VDPTNDAALATAETVNEGREIFGSGDRRISFKIKTAKTQIIRATLAGDDTCTAAGMTVRAAAPISALCRRLVAAGHDPATPLDCYRGAVLALRVRSIGSAARLAVKSSGNGTPIFAPVANGAAASPMRANGLGLAGVAATGGAA
jgi:hypothetical protein